MSENNNNLMSSFMRNLSQNGADASGVRDLIAANAENCGGIIAASLTTNGYVKFANGLILQW